MSQTKFKVIENNNMDKENRNKTLEAAVSLIEKNYGKGSIMKLGSKANVEIESISTGSLSLDIALGIGGVPKGRIVEIYGHESSGKTTLVLALLRLIKAKGEINFDQKNILNLNKRILRKLRKEMQIVFQDPFSSLSPRMNIEQIISEGLNIHENSLSIDEKQNLIISTCKM